MRTTLDWENISREEFYKILANKKNKVSSAATSPEEYYQIFKKYAEAGRDIISMSLSSKVSSAYRLAVSAAERIKKEFPERQIHCVDTCRISGSFGLLVAYACEMQNGGATFEQTVNWLEENKHRVHQMGPIDDLTFAARRGQISNSKAFMGNLVGVKPMGDLNEEGYVTVLAKVKGIKKALDITVSYIDLCATDLEDQYVFIMHSNREELAYALKERLEAKLTRKKIFVSDVFCGCGTNIGPGMICAYFLGEPISEGCVKEKQMLSLAISQNESRR
jgi:DegV family protein with EDD domain